MNPKYCPRIGAADASRGTVLLELALVLPFFLFGVFGAIEATRLLRVAQLCSMLSYQVGNLTFRKCAMLRQLDGTPDTARISKCLNDTVGNASSPGGIYDFAVNQLHIPPADIFATTALYQRNGASAPRIATHTFGTLAESSRVPALDSSFDSILRGTAPGEPGQSQVVVSEVFIRYRPVVLRVAGIGRVFPGIHYYDATIF